MPSAPLDVLLNSARVARDGEARMLAEALGNARAAEDRLQLLENFRHEYEMKFRERSSLGLGAEAWRNYALFTAQLDAAIEAQRGELNARRLAAEARRGSLAIAGRRLKSYETLHDRREEEARAALERREQKATDELAARRRPMLADR